MTFCRTWQAGQRVGATLMLDRWEVSQRARHGETIIECRSAGCGWRGVCGLVARCGRCGGRYIRLAAPEPGAARGR